MAGILIGCLIGAAVVSAVLYVANELRKAQERKVVRGFVYAAIKEADEADATLALVLMCFFDNKMSEVYKMLDKRNRHSYQVKKLLRLEEDEPVASGKHPGSAWIDAHYDSLPAGEHVAANAQGLVAHDPDLEVLMARLDEKKIDESTLAIMYVPESPGPVITRQTPCPTPDAK